MMFSSDNEERSLGGMLGWCQTSEEQLVQSEAKLLAHITSLDMSETVEIGPIVSPKGDRIRSYGANTSCRNTPLFLLHGFGCPSGLWSLNVDALARDRPVYFMDMLGFGRSSRPIFSKTPGKAEEELIESIEAWRKVIGLENFILLGHSLGAYLSTLYAMKYPKRVIHLILEDPWGFPRQPKRYNNNSIGVYTLWILSHFVPPLFFLRFLGPLGHLYIRWKLVPFDVTNYKRIVEDPEGEVYDYFYHCNAKHPSGELAFHSIMEGVAWPKFPLVERIHALEENIPITFLHGGRSWVSKKTSFKVKDIRKNSYVDIKVIENAAHVIHSDTPDEFNALVSRLLDDISDGKIPSSSLTSTKKSTGKETTISSTSERKIFNEASETTGDKNSRTI